MSENNILDLPLADFQAYLGEMRSNGRNTDDLVRMYRSHNSPFSAINSAADEYQQGLAESGRRSVAGGLLSKEIGTTGLDALRSVGFEGLGGLLGAGQALGQAFDAPYSAARNLIPQDDMSGEALGTAGLAMGGGGLAAGRGAFDYDPTTARMFAGPNARTADLDAMSEAEAALAGGADRTDVLRNTGWFRGVDGKMRFEIDDSNAVLRGPLNDLFNNAADGTNIRADVDRGLLHQELLGGIRRGEIFEPAYDELGYGFLNSTKRSGDQVEGSYKASTGDIEIGAPNPQEGKSVLFHELQHAIQQNEGFGRGSSPSRELSEIYGARNERKKELSRQMDQVKSEEGLFGFDAKHPRLTPLRDEYDALLGSKDSDSIDSRDAYNRSSGEVEARNTSLRSAMSAERRAETPPWETQDVPDDQQIVKFNANASQSGGLIGAGLSEAQRQARDILDMRADGRAGDVTDEMMARADDQYMFANTPLDMGEAARMARAGDAGFDTGTPLYHGSDNPNITAFDPSKGAEKLPATFLTDSRRVASTYGDNVGEHFANVEYPAELSFDGNSTVNFDGQSLTPGGLVRSVREASDDAKLYGAETETDLAFDLQGADIDPMYADEIDSVRMRNVVDDFGFGGDPANNLAVFDPRNIRNQSARFDPEFAHLSNLSAANASPTAGLLASGAQNPDKPLPFMEMLRGLLR